MIVKVIGPKIYEKVNPAKHAARRVSAIVSSGPRTAIRVFIEHVGETFATEGFGKWAPLAPRTVEERIALGYGGEHPILVRTGSLRDSLTRNSVIHLRRTDTSAELRIGTRHELFLIHQRSSRVNMPSRPMVPDTPKEQRELCKRLEPQVLRLLRSV